MNPTYRQIQLARRAEILKDVNVLWGERDDEIEAGLNRGELDYELTDEMAKAAEYCEGHARNLYRLAYDNHNWLDDLLDAEEYADYQQMTEQLRHGG